MTETRASIIFTRNGDPMIQLQKTKTTLMLGIVMLILLACANASGTATASAPPETQAVIVPAATLTPKLTPSPMRQFLSPPSSFGPN
jgi:hypothetical protein